MERRLSMGKAYTYARHGLESGGYAEALLCRDRADKAMVVKVNSFSFS